jgi:hypothetical protein
MVLGIGSELNVKGVSGIPGLGMADNLGVGSDMVVVFFVGA